MRGGANITNPESLSLADTGRRVLAISARVKVSRKPNHSVETSVTRKQSVTPVTTDLPHINPSHSLCRNAPTQYGQDSH